jgi:lysophospholipase L1-like esterase
MTVALTRLLVVCTLVVAAPVGLRAEDHVKTKMGETKKIVVIGASYAGGWNPGRPVAGYRIVTKGISGEESSQVLARFEADAIGVNPEAVVIWGFINDIFRGDPSRIDEILDGTRQNFQAMVDRARQAGVEPIIATEVTIRGKDSWSERGAALIGRILGKASYQDYVNGHVRKVNDWIRTMASREDIFLLDFEAVLSDNRGVRRKEFSQPDGSHISPLGYDSLTRYSEDRFSRLLESP